ncbi:hypothetical protein C8R41DRAFT_824034 [Lentinula lateritia]|uniref:non-specific serine/threonine protein kinase n=1 Tax=Lentinula lateritia TaxID=40482 RepID=A0ABQ8VKM0_9AGAR|nr:hypothetical protein C8R41DRAFT_824034 [Lentinula lateritia]
MSKRLNPTSSGRSTAASTSAAPQSRSLHDYQLGDSLGKGAFGQVYRALNWATGETVAIKQISLNNIPASELSSIMSEISLLKNLRHPNIVKYKGFVKTRMHLYIILEFCENGSLSQIGKRFGKFPEGLVGVYVSQVLEGLCYLHEQGVIHRDIKGANILTNKDGTVKLADFGVASSTAIPSGSSSAEVVGSPYWMAPEVIEQSGATTASDIWSLGCVVIELLEGSPPYSFLDPMPALWRIVQDDCPPIPEGASAVVKDFLACCFQKDPNLRIGARKLLRHPWMVGVRARVKEAEAEKKDEQGQSHRHSTDNTSSGEDWTTSSTSSSRSTLRLSKSSSRSPLTTTVDKTRDHIDKSSLLLSKSPTQTVSLSKSQLDLGLQRQKTQRQSRKPSQKVSSAKNNARARPSISPSGVAGRVPGTEGRLVSQYGYDEAVQRVQEWNQALSSAANLSSLPSSTSMTIKPQSLAVPVATIGMPPSTMSSSGSAGSVPTIRPSPMVPIPMFVPSSSASSASSGSGSGSTSSSSEQGKTIRPVFTRPPSVSSDLLGKKDTHPHTKDMKGKGKGPTLITPSFNTLGSFNALGGIAGVLTDQRKQLAFVEEEDEMDRDRWDDDFDLGEDDDFAARSKIDATKSKMDFGVGIRHSKRDALHGTSNSSGSSSDGEDTTLTSSSRIKPQPRARDDRTIRASPGASLSRLPSSSSSSPSQSSPLPPLLPSRLPVAAVMTRSASDTTSASSSGPTYHALSEAEEENYDDDFLGGDDDSGLEDGNALLERRVNEFKAKLASQRLQNQQGSSNRVGSFSRPLFHPDDIKSALFPPADSSQAITTLSSPSGSTSRPSAHGRTYSASATSSLSSSPFSAPLSSSPSGARRPQLTLPPSTFSNNHKRISPGPLTAPLPDMAQGNDDVWDADYEDEYDHPGPFSAEHNDSKNGAGGSGSVRRASATQKGSIGRIETGGRKGSVRSSGSEGGRNQGSSDGSEGRSAGYGTQNQRGSIRSLSEKFDKYTEHPDQEVDAEDFDYEDNNNSPSSTVGSGEGGLKPGLLKLNSRLSNRSWLGDEDDNSDEDVFAEFDEPFAEDDLETHLQRDKQARLSARVSALVDNLSLNANPIGSLSNVGTTGEIQEGIEIRERRLRDIVGELLTILVTSPEMQIQLVNSHGMLAILEVLEGYQSRVLDPQLGISASAQSSNSSPSPLTSVVPLPGSAVGTARKASTMGGVVSSLGLGSLASLGSLGIGGRSSSGVSATTSASTTSRDSLGISGSLPTHNNVTGIGGGLSAGGRETVLQLLRIINLLVTGNIGFLESFCLIGGIPVVMGLTSKRFPSECRLEASNFIQLMCHTSVLTLQMFISCRGLKVLVALLDEDSSPLVAHALNGISSVFDLQSPTTKYDFCRMFVREGLLDPLSGALLNVMANGNVNFDGKRTLKDSLGGEKGEEYWGEENHRDSVGLEGEMKMKIIQILLVFSQVSQSDFHVRNAVGTRKVIRRLLRACELLEPECLVLMIKAVKHLSMNISLLDVLQNANAIEILVRILEEQTSGPYNTEISNHIFQTCFNLCRLNKSRQEEAAQAGIIPCLQRVAETQSPLKQFAIPILCDMASAGKNCRKLLWQHDVLNMYLRLLEDPYFQVSALESILSWLQDEPARVEDGLTEPSAIRLVLDCFVTAKTNSFENLLELFLKLTRISTRITTSFSRSPAFFRRVADRLGHNTKPVVRLNLLRILKTVCDAHPNRGMLVEKYGSGDGLLGVVEGLSRGGGDGAVLVRELAREIIPVLRPGLKPLPSGRASGRGVTPKRMRRTASEASAPVVDTGFTGSAVTVGVASGGSILSTDKTGLRPTAASRSVSTRPKASLRDISWQGTR